MNTSFLLSPSILSADFTALGNSLDFISKNGGDWIHVDVMDGHFVPNLTIGPPVIKALRTKTSLPLDVHLMISNPSEQLDDYINAGADWLTFHFEAAVHAHRLITRIHEAGIKAGISIVPSTPVSFLTEILPFIDLVLIMTVNPGFGGQVLIPSCLDKVKELKKIKQENDFSYIVSVDGGINSTTLDSAVNAGADVIVSGTSFFSGDLPTRN